MKGKQVVDDVATSAPLPPDSSIRGRPSPLSGVIAEGLNQLARAEGWEAQQNALDVLVGAMVKSGKGASPGSETMTADAMSELEFGKLLARHAGPERKADAKRDAKQLAALTVVALGTNGLDGQRKVEVGKQMAADLGEIRAALDDVLARPAAERTARLEGVVSDLEWVASVLSRSKSSQPAQPRLDAVAGMLKILLRYATGPSH